MAKWTVSYGRGTWREGGDCLGSPRGLPRGAHQDFPRQSAAATLEEVHPAARTGNGVYPAGHTTHHQASNNVEGGYMRWGGSEGVDEGNDVGLPMGNVVFWMYEVGWRASERIGEGNGVGPPRGLPAGKQLE